MNEDERKRFGNEIARPYYKKARVAREEETASIRCTAWSKLNTGKSTYTDGVFDTGCTHPITTKSVVEGIGLKIEPLKEVLEIISANVKPLELLGSCRMFIKADNLGGMRMINCAVIDGEGSQETLILLEHLKKMEYVA